MLAGWGMAGDAMHQRHGVSAVRMMFSMWLTEGVTVRRMEQPTEAEKAVLSEVCIVWGASKGQKRWAPAI